MERHLVSYIVEHVIGVVQKPHSNILGMKKNKFTFTFILLKFYNGQ